MGKKKVKVVKNVEEPKVEPQTSEGTAGLNPLDITRSDIQYKSVHPT